MNYERIRLRPSQFESVTSLDVSEFDILLPLFKVEIDRVLRYTSRGTIRKNRLNYPLTLPSDAHVLFFTLTYLNSTLYKNNMERVSICRKKVYHAGLD